MARKSMTAYRLMPSEEIGSFKQVKTTTAFICSMNEKGITADERDKA
ncbi:uncharacterized protein RSE6_05975 [Rhynchosporium secalis]|uniref:Uncharacterized protein n=1 Tax=Rhynchosporium secalis TaxID=38038 RepID=A0A1E1M968_RHYSE|nr:uncharacterized protein RSE6_05975 [Rhynchosporium secalis]